MDISGSVVLCPCPWLCVFVFVCVRPLLLRGDANDATEWEKYCCRQRRVINGGNSAYQIEWTNQSQHSIRSVCAHIVCDARTGKQLCWNIYGLCIVVRRCTLSPTSITSFETTTVKSHQPSPPQTDQVTRKECSTYNKMNARHLGCLVHHNFCAFAWFCLAVRPSVLSRVRQLRVLEALFSYDTTRLSMDTGH